MPQPAPCRAVITALSLAVVVVGYPGMVAGAAAQVPTTRVVIMNGDAAPDGDGNLAILSNPVLNDAGQVAFNGYVQGIPGTGFGGIYRGDGGPGNLIQIARTDDLSPDANGIFSNLGAPSLNDAGQVAFNGTLTNTAGGSNDDRGIFLGDGTPGSLVQIAREGQSAPGGSGMFSYLDSQLSG